MGQCFSLLSRRRNRGKIAPLAVTKNDHSRPESGNEENSMAAVGKKVDIETKRKVEEAEKNIEDGSSRRMEKEVEDVESISSEGSVPTSADVRELTDDDGAKENTAQGKDEALDEDQGKNRAKQAEGEVGDEDLPKDPAVKPQEASPRVIVVQPATNSSFSFGSRDRRAGSDSAWPNINQVASLISQKTACVYKYQGPDGKPEVVKREWDVEGLRRLANTAAQPSECGLEKEADNIVKNKGFKQSVASQGGESEGEAKLCDETDEMKVEQDHLLILGVGFGQPKGKLDHRKIKEKIRASASRPVDDVAARDVPEVKNVRGNSVKFSKEDPKESAADTDQRSWLMKDKESDELDNQMTSSRSEKMDSQNGLAATDVATPARSQKVIPRRKASNLVHLIVRDRLFGSMDEPTVSGVDVQRQVTLGIADEEYWMPGHGNSSNNQGVTLGRKEIGKKSRAGGHRQQPEDDARLFKAGQKSKDKGGAKPKDREQNKATRGKQVVANAQNLASHEHDKSNKPSSEDASTSPEKAGKKVSDVSTPYWTLKDVPNTSWSRPGRLTYKQDKTDVKTEMKNIESEMAALLKPDEKCVNTCIAFTIGEGKQNGIQASGNVPRRLARKQKVEVDQVKILEKQRQAEQRRKDNIAKRVQSARRRSSTPKPKSPTGEKEILYAKTMERIGAAIARRDEIISQRIHVAKKSCQLKENVVRSREVERSKVKENVFQRAEAARARRHEIMDRRVQAAIKSGNPRQHFVEERMAGMSKEKEQVFEKIEAATSRRNEILNQRVEIARRAGASRGDEVKERQSKMADRQQHVLDRKMRTIEENRERMIRKKVRYQAQQEKLRELVRRRLARLKRDDEETLLQFGEMQLETYEDSDDGGENVWDDE